MMTRSSILSVFLLALAVSTGPVTGQEPPGRWGADVVSLPGGTYHAFYVSEPEGSERDIGPFRLDARPVTVAEFLAFVTAAPEWRRDVAPAALVGTDYLSRWDAALEPGGAVRADRPVTEVSWFAARAYCRWTSGRLPTTEEWEYAAQASETSLDAWGDPAFRRGVLRMYTARAAADELPPAGSTDRNAFGVRDLHGLVWEWTADFNNQTLTGAGRDDRGLDRQLFCAAGALGVADPSDYAGFLRWSYRASLVGSTSAQQLGFRCAR
jgi:formylglycine-generating enzyme required for sulfatase activity